MCAPLNLGWLGIPLVVSIRLENIGSSFADVSGERHLVKWSIVCYNERMFGLPLGIS